MYLYFYRRLQLVHHLDLLLPQQDQHQEAEVEGGEEKVVLQLVWKWDQVLAVSPLLFFQWQGPQTADVCYEKMILLQYNSITTSKG